MGGTAEPPPPEPRPEEEEELPISLRSDQEQLAYVPEDAKKQPKQSYASSRRVDPRLEDYIYSMYDKDKLLKSLGVSSLDEIDPYSPDVYIKPRPGKYGWKPIELTKEYKRARDRSSVQTMTDNEREENLKVHKQLYEDSVKLNRLGDRESASKARIESNERMDADPWFNLNERMEEAVKIKDEEEISYLKEMIEKMGGPPPSLKDKVNENGYVPVSSIYSLTLSNDRLDRLINDYKKEEQMELLRKDMVLKELEEIDEAKYDTREEDELWVAEMAEKRYWDRVYWMGEKVPVNKYLVENRKEKMDKERKVSCIIYFACVVWWLLFTMLFFVAALLVGLLVELMSKANQLAY